MQPVEFNRIATPDVGQVSSPACPENAIGADYTYEMPYRRTHKTGAITWPVAICLECMRVIVARRIESSRTGAHGKMFFAHEHPLAFTILKQSNSGKRTVEFVGEIPENFKAEIRELWTMYNIPPEIAMNTIHAMLRAHAQR